MTPKMNNMDTLTFYRRVLEMIKEVIAGLDTITFSGTVNVNTEQPDPSLLNVTEVNSGDILTMLQTISLLESSIDLKLSTLIDCECRNCNTWQIGKINGTSKTVLAGTAKSITIIVESGTVTVGNGIQSSELSEGESISITASSLFENNIIIDGALGTATWVMVTCEDSLTTTDEPTTTELPN